MRPDATAVLDFLARASRRVTITVATQGAAAGLVLAVVLVFAGWPARGLVASSGVVFALAFLGAAAAVALSRARGRSIASVVEARAPECRNLVITAAELPSRSGVADHVASLVYDRAARLTRQLDLSTLFPARGPIVSVGLAAALWAVVVTRPEIRATVGPSSIAAGAAPSIDGVDVTVTPPAYANRPAQMLRDPARIEALAGSRVRVAVRARASRVVVETIRSRDTLAPSAAGVFVADLVADADGYIALEPAADGRAGVRRLIGLSVISDDAPRVRITTPGRDLILGDAQQTIDLAIEAGDDIGLASVRLRYTRVSGSGERFTFTEGELPIDVVKKDPRAWTARAAWKLEPLALGAGDMVVYRAVAADNRPGAPPTESDAFIAEMPAPGGQAAPGFAIDPEQERYAVSQQMVIIKTERLAARRSSMPQDEYATAAHEIAAEQRKVRAEFVFMMGGELSDVPDETSDMTEINEEAEAAGEDDLLAGRAANQGRLALLRAIRSMSRAAAALTSAELTPALRHERAALTQLERAFSRTRIILRALSERERLDLSRRLTGTLSDAARSSRPRTAAVADPRVVELRRSLAGIAALAGATQPGVDEATRASRLAENVLRVDPSDTTLHHVAALLTSAAEALRRARTGDAHDLLDRAATGLAAALRTDLLDAPVASEAARLRRIGGALNDALRNSRGGR